MELLIHLTTLPENMSMEGLERGLDEVLEDDGWLVASAHDGEKGFVEIELEDETKNPKHGIIGVKNYLRTVKLPPETTIELAGKPVGIYQ